MTNFFATDFHFYEFQRTKDYQEMVGFDSEIKIVYPEFEKPVWKNK